MKFKVMATALLATLCCGPVWADDAPQAESLLQAVTGGKPMINFRLRYETVDQDGKRDDAHAMTLRSLVGWQTAPFHDFSVAAQLIGVSTFNEHYDNFGRANPEPGKGNYPRVIDPDYTGINQLYVEWSGLADTKIRLGRQSVKLDNVRLIGNIEFRQVMQVFDGLALENNGLLPDTSIYLAHFERVRQITTKVQNAHVDIANLRYQLTPEATLTGYGYLLDWRGEVKPDNLYPKTVSGKTFGLRLDGGQTLADSGWKALYTAEYAKQDDYKSGSRDIDSHYLRLGGGAQYSGWYARIDREILSSNRGRTAFQASLGTGHLFQGWADHFLVTPNHGIDDTFLSFGGKIAKVQLSGEYHLIGADRHFATPTGRGDRYGKELDLALAYSHDAHWLAKAEYARFREDDVYGAALTAASRKRDIEKLWLTMMYSF